MAGVRFPEGARDLSFHNVQNLLWVLANLQSKGYPTFFRGVKVTHSPPRSSEVKNYAAIPQLRHRSSWHSDYLITHEENFTFAFWGLILVAAVALVKGNMRTEL
jgi:hypothetical protein